MSLKKWFSALSAALLCVGAVLPRAAADDALPQPPCAAYIVMDAESGQVLMEHNADEVRFPASITKIMTLALAMEKAQGDWNQTVTVSYDSVHQLELGSSNIALMENEVIRLEDLLYATGMASANDGANALAQFIGEDGSIQSGVDAMNAKAAELGLQNTHYVNPHGLHNEDHYTTARDMARITRWAISVPGFLDVFCRNEVWMIEPTNLQPKQRPCRHTDWTRISGDYYRDYFKGSKTGFHDQAQNTFVNYSEQGDMKIISVEMGCPRSTDKFIAADMLMDYVFQHYHRVTVPAPQDAFSVDLVGGGGSLGAVTVKPQDQQFILHDSLNATDVDVSYDIPQQYILGRPFHASVHYTLKENEWQPRELGGGELQVEGIPQVIQANTYVPQSSLKPERNPVGFAVGVGAALLAVLLAMRLLHRGKNSRSSGAGEMEWDIISRQPLPSDETIYLKSRRDDGGQPRTKPQ